MALSSYSDDANNKMRSSSTFDHENILGNSQNVRFFDIEVDDDLDDVEDYDNNIVHDQLPSVEDAKIYSTTVNTTNRSQSWNKKNILLATAILGIISLGGILSRKPVQYRNAVESITRTVRVSHPEAFADNRSPQSMALNWMLNKDSMRLPLPLNRNDPFVQRYVVAVMVFSLTTGIIGPRRDYHRLISGVHECEWNEIDDEDKVQKGILCANNDSSSRSVTDIIFPGVDFHGEIPPEMEVLSHLINLDLSDNLIKGNIPAMPYLTNLDLAYNEFTGYLPDHFSEMSRLQILSLSENGFQGSLPHKFAALTNLEILALNGNQLTGELQEIYSLSNLREMYLFSNFFEDQLSNGSFKNLSKLQVIDMKNNRLSGPLPNALWKLTNLEVIDFHKNALDGHINNVIVEGHPLKYLDLSSNLLGGGLPQSFSNLHGLTHLDLSYNRLEVHIPKHLQNMTKMKTLLFTEGGDGLGPQPLPHWLRGMTDLTQLSFRLASRTGTIPTWFGELTRLELLDLDWNHISGTIPTELGQLTNLRYLMLNRNRMTGTIPTQVSFLPNLKMLMLDTNDFIGTVLSGQEDTSRTYTRCDTDIVGHRIPDMIANCGEFMLDDDTVTPYIEVECPCCTQCCRDDEMRCNMKDWVIELEGEYRGTYNR